MSIQFEDDVARMADVCPVEDAMELQDWLRRERARPPVVDLSACVHFHTAVFQVLLAARPQVVGAPQNPFLHRWAAPLLVGPAATAL